jgi:hypothetical protein
MFCTQSQGPYAETHSSTVFTSQHHQLHAATWTRHNLLPETCLQEVPSALLVARNTEKCPMRGVAVARESITSSVIQTCFTKCGTGIEDAVGT